MMSEVLNEQFEYCEVHDAMFPKGNICPACDAEQEECVADSVCGAYDDEAKLGWEMEDCHGVSALDGQPDAPEMPEDIQFPEIE